MTGIRRQWLNIFNWLTVDYSYDMEIIVARKVSDARAI